MDIYLVINLFAQYGLIFLFAIVLLEYMNLPGLPAGIIMPAAGILVAEADMKFSTALLISVIAGLLGSYVLYVAGYFLGTPLLEKYYNKYEKLRAPIDKIVSFQEKHGNKSILIARIVPVARTLVSLTAGVFRMRFWPFTLYSIAGIILWNLVFIYAGYAFGYLFLK